MSKVSSPELKKFMDKRIAVLIQGGRKVTGTLRGFDLFLNLVVDDAVDESSGGAGDKVPCGMVVIRGNSVTSIATLSA